MCEMCVIIINVEIDQCFTSGITPNTRKWPDSPPLCDSLVNSHEFSCHKSDDLFTANVLTESMPIFV